MTWLVKEHEQSGLWYAESVPDCREHEHHLLITHGGGVVFTPSKVTLERLLDRSGMVIEGDDRPEEERWEAAPPPPPDLPI